MYKKTVKLTSDRQYVKTFTFVGCKEFQINNKLTFVE